MRSWTLKTIYGICLLGLQNEKYQPENGAKKRKTVDPRSLGSLITLFEPLNESLSFLFYLAGMETTSTNWKLQPDELWIMHICKVNLLVNKKDYRCSCDSHCKP